MRILPTGTAGRWHYALLAEEVETDGFLAESYGVQITDTATNETAQLRHITINAAEIRQLLTALSQGRVTPTTLRDIVEDWVA